MRLAARARRLVRAAPRPRGRSAAGSCPSRAPSPPGCRARRDRSARPVRRSITSTMARSSARCAPSRSSQALPSSGSASSPSWPSGTAPTGWSPAIVRFRSRAGSRPQAARRVGVRRRDVAEQPVHVGPQAAPHLDDVADVRLADRRPGRDVQHAERLDAVAEVPAAGVHAEGMRVGEAHPGPQPPAPAPARRRRVVDLEVLARPEDQRRPPAGAGRRARAAPPRSAARRGSRRRAGAPPRSRAAPALTVVGIGGRSSRPRRSARRSPAASSLRRKNGIGVAQTRSSWRASRSACSARTRSSGMVWISGS